jgi:hypothetical protein
MDGLPEKHSPSRLGRAIPLLLLAAFAVQATTAALEDSVTIDEYFHVPYGVHLLDTGDITPDLMNPPLGKALLALPLVLWPDAFTSIRGAPPGGKAWAFHQANRDRYQAVILACRGMVILAALALGVLVFAWASRLYGSRAGTLALVLFAFSADLLGQGHLATLDLPGTLFFTLTCWAAWRLLDRPGFRAATLLGVSLGVAVLTKLSCVVLIPVVLLTLVAGAIRERRVGRWLAYAALAGGVALLVLNLGYGFAGTGTSLAALQLAPNGPLAALAQRIPDLPLPVPAALIQGLDLATTSGATSEPTYFLAGELSAKGWWYYHLAAFGLKTSLPLLVLGIASIGLAFRRRDGGGRAFGTACLFAPVAALFLAASLTGALQIGVRHVLAAVPLLIIPAAGIAAFVLDRALAGAGPPARRWVPAILVAALLTWHVAGTVAVGPRYLQFFNEIAGGPEGGHRYLVDSNLECGQDLIRLKDYLDEHGIAEVPLAYFGRVDPAIYGIRAVPLDRNTHGIAVVSPTFVAGRPYFGNLDAQHGWLPAGTFAWLRDHPPIDRVGALFVVRLP